MSPQDHSTALVTIPTNGVDTYRMSTDAANICRALVMATAQEIQGRKYVKVEGWQAIAIAHGCAASACNVERVDGGFRATGQVRRMDTGAVIAEAEGFVGEDEPVWFGGETTDKWGKKKTHPKRADFAIRAMAQTRAISRACRSAFAHVVVQIDHKLGTTPAEEMQGVYDHQPKENISSPADFVEEARKDGLIINDGKSQYEEDKLKAAIAADWKVTNKTAKGQLSQVGQYLDMARNADDVSKILNNNDQVIANSGEKDTIENDAAKLLEFFDAEAAKVHQ